MPPLTTAPGNLAWSLFYLSRDLTYAGLLVTGLYRLLHPPAVIDSPVLYYMAMCGSSVCQGIVWTGLWVIAHDCGHSGFSRWGWRNDLVGFVVHSGLLTPYFAWKSTHRRHHIYANHIEKDLNYVPALRQSYARQIGAAMEALEEVGQAAPLVLLLRIVLQQTIGWNWYILSNITCPPTAVVKKGMSVWRHSHFDPRGALFHTSEWQAVLLSDLGCLAALGGLYRLGQGVGSAPLLWGYVVPWIWRNHWIVMITYLHHTHPDVPKYSPGSWTFLRGATATIDRDFGLIGRHFFHHIASDHVTHHLVSRIPHYYSPVASRAIVPLLGRHYHGRGEFNYAALQTAFTECQWVEADGRKDAALGLRAAKEPPSGSSKGSEGSKGPRGTLWYRSGRIPSPEYKMRGARC
ncbi:hypothetical protein BO71DRAFT_453765 [Aspergillus ellipticus CBS 707.79]|uniref:Fatty acid desaturase domain-containing protein n=1 Tax=Aspergillus ellipticus CBS 707.79 TaxID=1448320 RepID=A0A319D376_9EURO|nr:hypothetical protein BO71DRAFT_453765 [Aspergillus ellipticus CBS 707.79]